MDKEITKETSNVEQDIVNVWLDKDIDATIKGIEDEQLFTIIMGQMLSDAAQEKQFIDWITSKNPRDVMKAGMALARPILCAYMFGKANADKLTNKEESDVKDRIITK